MSRTPFLILNFLDFDVYVVMTAIFLANQRRCASSSKNVAMLSPWSKRAIIAPNNLIDSHHYKRHKKIRMTEFHSRSLSILIITQSKASFLVILNYSKMIPRLVESFRNLHLFQNSIPYSQFLRLRRLCSDDSDFSSKSEEMCQFFEKRGYPVSVVKAGHHRAQQFDRQSSLQTSQKDKNDRIPFTLTFHPHNHAVKSIILSNFKLLQNDPETGRIFSQPPLISFKRDKNVGNFLVRSALKTNEQPGTFKCARSRCKTCLFIVNTSKISGPKRSVKITDRFTCTSANVIYCITCTLCNKLYIGETGRRLGDRFREHLRDVEKNDKDASKPVARHFNLPNHSKKHMAICGLSLHLGTTESRKNLEQKFIFQIGTLSPHGINERFSFN